MQLLPESANKLIDEFSRLPGIGKKTAQRLTFYLLNAKQGYVHDLSDALRDIKIKIKKCTICHGITENDPCMICSSTERDENTLCVVENAYDIFVFEKTNSFRGKYHVLDGALSPLDGIGPEELNISSLIDRIHSGMEIIIATNPSVEGETTSLYLSKILADRDIVLSKLARGYPLEGILNMLMMLH
ncbi:recombination protein RecR [bacterium]|nr:MAG: recombination protein RecR [bacterium]